MSKEKEAKEPTQEELLWYLENVSNPKYGNTEKQIIEELKEIIQKLMNPYGKAMVEKDILMFNEKYPKGFK